MNPNTFPPVSYTHLDVYKRQHLFRQLAAFLIAHISRIGTNHTRYGLFLHILAHIDTCLLYTSHYKAISEATDLPIVLYNVPGRTGVNMKAEDVYKRQVVIHN